MMQMDIKKYIMVTISSNVLQDYFSILYNYKATRGCKIPTFWLSSQLLLNVSLNVSNIHSMVIINSNFNLNDQKNWRKYNPIKTYFFEYPLQCTVWMFFGIDMNLIVKNARSILIINLNTLLSNVNKYITLSVLQSLYPSRPLPLTSMHVLNNQIKSNWTP